MDPDGVVGAAFLASDGYVDPSQLCHALAAAARAKRACRSHPHTGSPASTPTADGSPRVHTDRGDDRLRGRRRLRRHVRRRDRRGWSASGCPLVPMSHQYVVTDAFLERRDRPLPTLRDPDLLVYYRQEVDGLVMGGYERDRRTLDRRPTARTTTSRRTSTAGCSPRCWERFEEITANAAVRVPAMADVGLRKVINGPEAFTPDNEFLPRRDRGRRVLRRGRLLRARHRRRRRHRQGDGRVDRRRRSGPGRLAHGRAAGSAAQYRSPSYTLARTVETYETYYDIVYPGYERRGRPTAADQPGVPLARRARRVLRREVRAGSGSTTTRATPPLGDESLRPHGWAGRLWSPAIGAEHTRDPGGGRRSSTSRPSPSSR